MTKYVSLDDAFAERPISVDAFAVEKAKIRAEIRAYQLAELRKTLDLTQKELADRIGVGQTRVSAIEHGDLRKTEVGTLAAYVEALGGELEVSVRVGDNRLLLT